MGDRTYATLTIAGVLASAADAQMLVDEISSQGGRDTNGDLPTMPTEAGTIPAHFGFEEMNYGDMPDSLHNTLYDLGLAYIWAHEDGDQYIAAGTVVVDDCSHTQHLSHNGLPFLEHGEFDDPEKRAAIAEYMEASKKVQGQDLVYAPTAHALLAHFEGKPEALEAWKAMREARAA